MHHVTAIRLCRFYPSKKMAFGGSSAAGEASGSGSGSYRSNMNISFLTPDHISWLESVFKVSPLPSDVQIKQISELLGCEPCQIQFWFQNRRTRQECERTGNNSLHLEMERIQFENLAMKEAHDVIYRALETQPFNLTGLHSYIVKLILENTGLKKERDSLAAQVSQLTGTLFSKANSRTPTVPPVDFTIGSGSSSEMRDPAFHHKNAKKGSTSAPLQADFIPNVEKSTMMEIARAAAEELFNVISSNEPLWMFNNGRYSLNRDFYETLFMKSYRFKQNITGKLESSKDSCEVPINAIALVNMMLDSSMWLDLFPTLVTNTTTLDVVETGMPGVRSGSLQLMREVMHALSPLVTPREFYFLRYCHQVDEKTWVIVDVSHGIPKGIDSNQMPPCRKLLSGCMIQHMHDEHSKVSWVELVEVDDRITTATHSLYSDLISSGLVFGAERWITTLQKMCERALIANKEPPQEALMSVEGKRSLLDLSHRMVREFCANLNMPVNNPQLNQVPEGDEIQVRVTTRVSTDTLRRGTVFWGATSLCLPLRPKHVFAFFQDKRIRSKWDFLSHGKPVTEIAHVASGHGRGNYLSVFKPIESTANEFPILQEIFSDSLGYYVVCAPIDITTINKAVTGLSTSDTPILPSGFVISGDGRSGSGSLVTVLFQILLDHPARYIEQNYSGLVSDMKELVKTSIEDIKAALVPSTNSSF